MICENSCLPCFQQVVAATTWHDLSGCWYYFQPAAQSHLLLEVTLSSLQCTAFLICHCCVWLSGTGILSPFEINTAQWLRTKAFPDNWDVISHTSSGQWTPYILRLHLKASIFCVFALLRYRQQQTKAMKVPQRIKKNNPEPFLQVSRTHEITLTAPTAGPKTNKQHRLNKQMGYSAAHEVNVDQWVTKQHVYQKNHIPAKHLDPSESFLYFICEDVNSIMWGIM